MDTSANVRDRMRAVQFHCFGPAADVLRIEDVERPDPGAGQVEVAVRAASVNPSDCAIRAGYGSEVFRHKGQVGPGPFPQRIGRDFAGIVTRAGPGVVRFQPGDRVYAAPTFATMTDFVCVDEREVAAMPHNLDFVAAASLPFVALTTWTALVKQVGLTARATPGKRVVVTRGAGGVGCFAIQFMKAWGAYVATTCSTRNVDFVRQLGADEVVDYTRTPVAGALRDFDIVLDGSFDLEPAMLDALKQHAGASYITIVSPKIRLADEFGMSEGMERARALFDGREAGQRALGRHYYWGFMEPDGAALSEVTILVESGLVRPVIDRTFALEEIVAAHEYCESRQARGKIVVTFE